MECFQLSFHKPFQGTRKPFCASILGSVKGVEHIVRDKIKQEIIDGRVLGLFTEPPLPTLHLPQLGTLYHTQRVIQ